jgi:hypothetical protein
VATGFEEWNSPLSDDVERKIPSLRIQVSLDLRS